MTGQLTDAEPFESLEVMKSRHKELLRTSPPGESASDLRRRVLEFLARGTATGLVLDDPADRRVAQGILDYWKATLYTQLREAEAGTSGAYPAPTILKDFPEDDTVRLVAAAENAVSALNNADREVARKLLQRLLRLEPAVREFHPVAVPRAVLDELGNVGQVAHITHILEKAGVIRSIITPLGEPRVELAAGHLVRTWPRYGGWLKDRLAFRTAAYLWQQQDRHPSALVAGPPLAQAAAYHDLDALEGEFARASRLASERARKVRFWLWIGGLVTAVVVLAVIAALQSARIRSERERAEEAERALEARDAFVSAERGWKAERDRLEKQKRDAQEARKLLQQRQKIERVFNINRMIRSLSDIVAASGEYEQLALWRWQELEKELRQDPYFERLLNDHKNQLAQLMGRNSQVNRGPIVMAIAREVRDDSLRAKDQEVMAMLRSVRDESYRIVRQVVQKLDQDAGAQRAFAQVRPYQREFLRYYWGALAMVESPDVEAAMVKFKYALDDWERWDRDRFGSWMVIRDGLHSARKSLERALDQDLKEDIRPSAPRPLPRK